MTATANVFSSKTPINLRPIEPTRDLGAVADLVELCFQDKLDEDGRRYVRQMRNAAANSGLFGAAALKPMKGFVWEENDKIIGNLNMVPVFAEGQRAYLIANVTVHPTRRRRGIARALTDAAINLATKRSVRYAWLQVDADNPPAIDLYEKVGFIEQARRTTWHTSQNSIPHPGTEVKISNRKFGDWGKQKIWLNETYPDHVRWHLAISPNLYRPGISGMFTRAFSDKNLRQWSAFQKGELLGTITWQSSHTQADWLWLAAAPQYEAESIPALINHARRGLRPHRTLAVNYPADRAVNILENTGLHPHQTLIWMRIDLNN